MSIELNPKETVSRLKAISNDLNKLDNYNKKDRRYKELYISLDRRLKTEWRRFKQGVRVTTITRSRKLNLKPVFGKFRNLRNKFQLKYPSFPMNHFMAHSRFYIQNNSRLNNVKKTNNAYLNRHEFVNHYVNDLPKDAITLKNIKSGNRAIKINKSIYSLQSFRNLTRSSINGVLRLHGNSILFVDPLTRQTIRRSQITPIKIIRGPSASEIYGNNV